MPITKKPLAALAPLLLAALVTGILASATASARPAVAGVEHLSIRNAKPEQIFFTFTKKRDRFRKPDANSVFNAAIHFGSKKLPMPWSFQLSKAVKAIAFGDMACKASATGHPGYHDNHPKIPVDSTWHSNVPENHFNIKYVLSGSCTFKVNVNGEIGHAVLSFKFHYVIR